MEHKIPDAELSGLSAFIAERLGLHFPPERWNDLRQGVEAAARELHVDDVAAWARQLTIEPPRKDHLETLAGNLTVGETYFFRDHRIFEILAEQILPGLIHARRDEGRRLRIWSAACCTGEEAYSIAIQLRRTIPDLEDWNVTFLATDVNPRFLRKAVAGVYGEWSFRNAPAWLKPQYFRPTTDRQFEILPEIRRMVRFTDLNLVEDIYPSVVNDTNAMDIVFCRNVLMYFTAAQANKVLQKLYRTQVTGGWLVVSPGEMPHVSPATYTQMNFSGSILYHKESDQRQGPDYRQHTPAFGGMMGNQTPGELPAPAVQPLEVSDLEETHSTQQTESPEFQMTARSLANEGKLTEALGQCEQWIAADKMNPSAHHLRAVILQEQGDTAEAIRSLRRALYLDPNLVLAHFALGNIARSRRANQQANKHLKNALDLLQRYNADDIVPQSDGVTAGRLAEIIVSIISLETVA